MISATRYMAEKGLGGVVHFGGQVVHLSGQYGNTLHKDGKIFGALRAPFYKKVLKFSSTDPPPTPPWKKFL